MMENEMTEKMRRKGYWLPSPPTKFERWLAHIRWAGLLVIAIGPILARDWRTGAGLFALGAGMMVLGLATDVSNTARWRIRKRLLDAYAPIAGE